MDNQSLSNILDEFWTSLVRGRDADKKQLKLKLEQHGTHDENADSGHPLAELLEQLFQLRSGSVDPPSDEKPWQTGDRIGQYEILEKIGQGGMGVVYRALQKELGREVALKTIRTTEFPDSETRRRFKQEATAASLLNHPNIVSVHEIAEHDGHLFFSMELVVGESLKSLIDGKPFQPRRAARILSIVAKAIDYAHQMKTLHRDIKPSNILLDADENPHVVDFGLARNLNSAGKQSITRLTHSISILGTPGYLSPEQVTGESPQRQTVDVYGLGATLYEALCGRPPFSGDSVWETLRQVVQSEPVPPAKLNPAVPLELDAICLKAIHKDPEQRYATAAGLGEDLGRWLDGNPTHARPLSKFGHVKKWYLRNPALATSMTLLAVAIIIGGVVSSIFWLQSQKNASLANQRARDLNESQIRMRESVRKFQRNIFSNEALHWEMSEDFRQQMFEDVMAYLDEFERDEFLMERATDSEDALVSDYLVVARASYEAAREELAHRAASKALARIRILNASTPPGSDNLRLHFECLKLAYNTLDQHANRERESIADEMATVAQKGISCKPDDLQFRIGLKTARIAKLFASNSLNHFELSEAHEIFDDLTELRIPDPGLNEWAVQADAKRTAISLAWALSSSSDDSKAISLLERNEKNIDRLLEYFRKVGKPLSGAERIRGRNRRLLAQLQYETGNSRAAISELRKSTEQYSRALVHQSRNTIWRRELAAVLVQQSEWLRETGKPEQAIARLDQAVMQLINIIRYDPRNWEVRKLIVKLFVSMADLEPVSANSDMSRNKYYIAAQDCRLLLTSEQHRNWAIQTRFWLIAKVRECCDKSLSESARERWHALEKHWIQTTQSIDPSADESRFHQILNGTFTPERPSDLREDSILQPFLSFDGSRRLQL